MPGRASGARAHALLRFLEQQACSGGYRQVWLSTRRGNLRAVAFYRRLTCTIATGRNLCVWEKPCSFIQHKANAGARL
ncbi:hypothetical protein D8L93_01320 [Sodalis-like symbiont of Bactericera trigonica]|nr:hypothetical protein D8L93_01320 [Sodalis-like symbiont of Bactericera trigonica]